MPRVVAALCGGQASSIFLNTSMNAAILKLFTRKVFLEV